MIQRPFRSPHHTSTKAALIGGGNQLMPGEISLCHHGVLFLDELLEFKRTVLEVLREPLERKSITISRCSGSVSYPANFMLVASLNPCPCGYYLSKVKECSCTELERRKYLSKLSGPFLDRIDMFSFTYQHKYEEMVSVTAEESSKNIKKRVEAARNIQRERFLKENMYCNADMSSNHIKIYCSMDSSSENVLNRYFNKFPFSMRIYNRILKISRTIADLDNCKEINSSHVVEAISYRQFTEEEII
jgi:magnesium chelatase family protein